MNALIPRAPRRSPGESVRAMATITPAAGPLETHAFVPFNTQQSPSRTACVRSEAASEPASVPNYVEEKSRFFTVRR